MNESEIIFGVGALIGAGVSLWFIARSVPDAQSSVSGLGKRQLALILTLMAYFLLSLLALIVGVAIGHYGFAVAAALLCLLTIAACLVLWRSDVA
jgi:hypothetical protein